MLFIRYLLSDQEQNLYRILFILMKRRISTHNQKAIIETALSFGFVPILHLLSHKWVVTTFPIGQ